MLRLEEIYNLFQAELPAEFTDVFIEKISTDTRDLGTNSVFVALKGEKFDAHDFIASALENGAEVAIAQQIPQGVPAAKILLVEDTLRAYQQIAAYHRSKFHIPVIGITGSNGKTSTKDLTAACLGASLKVLKNHANFNNEIGVPKTLLQLNEEHQAAIVEMGMRGLGQIALLTKIARPDIAVITTVNATHIELLGSVDNIARAKAEIFENFDGGHAVILNYDNPYTKNMQPPCPKIYFGLDERADISAKNIIYTADSTTFDCVDKLRQAEYSVRLNIVGEHNVSNALAALAVAAVMKIELSSVLQGLAAAQISDMRQSIEKYPKNITVINDAYNAGPVSMHMAIKSLRAIGKTARKIAVLGDMLELGSLAQLSHEDLAVFCAQEHIELLLLYGELTKFTYHKAQQLQIPVRHFDDQQALAEVLSKELQPGDVLLFKGSRGMKMENIINLVFKNN